MKFHGRELKHQVKVKWGGKIETCFLQVLPGVPSKVEALGIEQEEIDVFQGDEVGQSGLAFFCAMTSPPCCPSPPAPKKKVCQLRNRHAHCAQGQWRCVSIIALNFAGAAPVRSIPVTPWPLLSFCRCSLGVR